MELGKIVKLRDASGDIQGDLFVFFRADVVKPSGTFKDLKVGDQVEYESEVDNQGIVIAKIVQKLAVAVTRDVA